MYSNQMKDSLELYHSKCDEAGHEYLMSYAEEFQYLAELVRSDGGR